MFIKNLVQIDVVNGKVEFIEKIFILILVMMMMLSQELQTLLLKKFGRVKTKMEIIGIMYNSDIVHKHLY